MVSLQKCKTHAYFEAPCSGDRLSWPPRNRPPEHGGDLLRSLQTSWASWLAFSHRSRQVRWEGVVYFLPSEEAGSPQVFRFAQLPSQRPAHPLAGHLHVLGGFHGLAQGPVEILQAAAAVEQPGAAARLGLLRKGPSFQLCGLECINRKASWRSS